MQAAVLADDGTLVGVRQLPEPVPDAGADTLAGGDVVDGGGGAVSLPVEPALEANEVAVPDAFDLDPGRYRWNGEQFVPISDRVPQLAPTLAGDPARALAELVQALAAAGLKVPAYSAGWASAFLKN